MACCLLEVVCVHVCVCVQLLVTLVKSIADKQTDVDQLLRSVVFGARKLTKCLYSCVYLVDSTGESSVRFALTHSTAHNYLCQGGYVFRRRSLFVCLFDCFCVLSGLRNVYSTNFHKIQWKGGT